MNELKVGHSAMRSLIYDSEPIRTKSVATAVVVRLKGEEILAVWSSPVLNA